MPWCGYFGAAGGAFWWILPLVGLVFMAMMLFPCFRGGFGCIGRRRRAPGDPSAFREEVDRLRDEVRKLQSRTS